MRSACILPSYVLFLDPTGQQEVKTAAEEAIKDLAAHERRSVGLEERRKHATGKAKKLKKSLSDVRNLNTPSCNGPLIYLSLFQDRRAKDDAARAIDDNSDKMEREKANVEEHEASLEQEEKVLEGIRDSLKGSLYFMFQYLKMFLPRPQIRRKSFTIKSR
jgi:structural maintenance of chromosome 4